MRQMNNIIAWVALLTVLAAIKPLTVEARQSTVFFDEGHGQRFLVEKNGTLDLSGLSSLFHKDGLQEMTITKEITGDVFAGADALVISGAFAPLTPSEISTVFNFDRKGGRLCVMLHIGSPVIEQAESIAQTTAKAWLDTNLNNVKDPEEKQRCLNLAIAGKLGEGSFAVFGDDAILQNQFLSEENLQLAKNLVRWLKGDKSVLSPNHTF